MLRTHRINLDFGRIERGRRVPFGVDGKANEHGIGEAFHARYLQARRMSVAGPCITVRKAYHVPYITKPITISQPVILLVETEVHVDWPMKLVVRISIHVKAMCKAFGRDASWTACKAG